MPTGGSTGGRLWALERHRTPRTAIEWSYGLCSPAERRLWTRLSVFAGTFSLGAAEEVCAEVEPEQPDVVKALIELVDNSACSGRAPATGSSTRCASSAPSSSPRRARRRRAGHIGRYLAKARHFGEHFADDDQMDR